MVKGIHNALTIWNCVLSYKQNYCFRENQYVLPRSYLHKKPGRKAQSVGRLTEDTRSDHLLSFLLPLIQEGQLSVTGKSMCTINHLGGLSLPRKSVARLTDCPNMTIAVYCGCKTTIQHKTTFRKKFPGSNFLLPTFLNGIYRWQI